jgi:hypothetical protein
MFRGANALLMARLGRTCANSCEGLMSLRVYCDHADSIDLSQASGHPNRIARPAHARPKFAPDRADPNDGHRQTRLFARSNLQPAPCPKGFARSATYGSLTLLRRRCRRCRFGRCRCRRCRRLRRRSWLRCVAACRTFTPRLSHYTTNQGRIIFAAVSVGLNHHKNSGNDDQNQNNSHSSTLPSAPA